MTVLLPVRNGADYLGEAIDSILAQTVTDLTLVIVDDGSRDDSLRVAQAHADDRTVIVADNRHAGLAARLNWGLDHARTRYVARMDADDVALPQRLALQLARFDRDPGLAICGGQYEAFSDAGERWRSALPATHAAIAALTLFNAPFGHPTVMFDMRELDRCGLRYRPHARHAEDYELWERALAMVRMANLDEVVLRYRLHPAQTAERHREEQRAVADAVRRRALERLGIGFSAAECALHCMLGERPHSVAPAAARAWLGKLAGQASRWTAAGRAIRAECRHRARALAGGAAAR